MLESRRGDLEGVEEQFVGNMIRGLDAWTSAAGRDLIRWGFIVLRKKVGGHERGPHTAEFAVLGRLLRFSEQHLTYPVGLGVWCPVWTES